MTNADAFLTTVVHGDAKVGKTRLGSTAPPPILFLDAEAGGMRFVPGAKLDWDPLREDVPDMKDHTICRVSIKDTMTLDTVVDYLRTGKHPFVSVVFDSLTEYQSRLKREISPSGDLDVQDWGKILVKIEDAVMALRDFVESQEPMMCFVLITGTQFRDEKFRPMLQGGMKDRLSYKLDATGYLFTAKDAEGVVRRGLRIVGDGKHDAGNRFPGDNWPEVLWDPNLESLIAKIETKIGEL